MGHSKPEAVAGHCENLQEAFDDYFDILTNGCDDPFWEDGTNINLCVNHFYYYKERIKKMP
jgi:hypothetical protein